MLSVHLISLPEHVSSEQGGGAAEPGGAALANPPRSVSASLPIRTARRVCPEGAVSGCRGALAHMWFYCQRHAHRVQATLSSLATACAAVSLFVKLKICLSFAQVAAQIGDVYLVRYDGGALGSYRSNHAFVFAPFRLNLLGWLPGWSLSCFGLAGLQTELLLMAAVPLIGVLAALALTFLSRRELLEALPFILRWTFLVHPLVSSKGFQVLGPALSRFKPRRRLPSLL